MPPKIAVKHRSVSPEAGFTLMELLVVLGIIALLTALVAPQVMRYLGDARTKAAQAQVKNLESAVELYYLDTGSYPSTEAGLKSLLEAPQNVAGWRGPYLKSAEGLSDPWGKPYSYSFPGTAGEFEIISLGRDGAAGGEGEDRDIRNR